MKSTVHHKPQSPNNTLPKLMRGRVNGGIVLVTKHDFHMCTGTVMNSGNSDYAVGHVGNWRFDAFEPFNGTVTLEN